MAGIRIPMLMWRAIGGVTALVALSANVSATLGRDASSVDADRVRMQGALLRIARSDAYTVHELRSASGTTRCRLSSSTPPPAPSRSASRAPTAWR